jgi:uncharacterized protein
MYFVLLCRDKPGALQLRLDTRPVHVEWLNDMKARGMLKIAGPMLDADGKPEGSLLILEADSAEAARAAAAEDPYARVGLFADVELKPWNWVVNPPAA